MSSTAQKQDLSDPNVVAAFAERVGTRAAAHRALSAHGRRHPRHEPQGMERVEGAAARGSVPRDARAARGSAGGVTLADSLLARQREAQRLLRLVRRGQTTPSAQLWAQARHRLLPAAYRGRDRVARAASPLARGGRGAGRAGAAVARRSRAAGRGLSTGPEAPVRPDQRILRAPRDCPSSKPRSTRPGTATRSTRSRCTIPRTPTRRIAMRSRSSSSSSRRC